MVPLDSPEWQGLRDAYGVASDIPELLRQLRIDTRPKNTRDEPWWSLWSALCHQGDAYSASYAAVPHIVQIGLDAAEPIDIGFFLLPACIEVARAKGKGPPVPLHLDADYRDALHRIHECAFRHAVDDWNSEMAQSVAAALAAAKGQHELAEAIINLDKEIIARLAPGTW
jgi:hypothetical protein